MKTLLLLLALSVAPTVTYHDYRHRVRHLRLPHIGGKVREQRGGRVRRGGRAARLVVRTQGTKR